MIDKLLLNVPEAADALSLGRSKLYELFSEGAINTVKVGHRRLVPVESLEAYVASLVKEA